MKLVLASNNQNKLRELCELLADIGAEVLSQAQSGFDQEVEESGSTFAENSLLKAEAVCKATGMVTIADDSGLVVDALHGAPGVYSHRYGTPDLDDEGRNNFLLQNMQGVTRRSCRFVSVVTCCFPDGRCLTSEGTCEGEIAQAPVGENGFGYDPIFYIPELGKTFAELSNDEKNALSHRGKALIKMKELLKNEL